MASPPETRPGYRADIDGMRALAVLLVVSYHAFPETVRGGFMGVDMFFVISGYLITGLLHQAHAQGNFSFRDFYARRARRLLPALIPVLAACWAFGFFALLPSEFAQLGRHMVGAATFSSNVIYWHEAGYFDSAAATKPLLHLWSLAIEEQFYLLYPLLVWGCWRLRFLPERMVLALLLLSFAANYLLQADRTMDFYFPITRWWELLLGAAVALAAASPSPASARLALVCLPGGALIMAGLYLIAGADAYPGTMALLPTMGTALLIAAGPRGMLNRVLGWRPCAAIGRISYPLYLWHWPLISYATIIAPEPLSSGLRWALVAASLLLAAATYRWVERPLRFGAVARVHSMLAAFAIMGAVGLAAHACGGWPSRPAGKYVDNQHQLLRLPWRDDACAHYLGTQEPVSDYCRYRDAGGKQTFALVGDSFSHVAFPGIADYLAERGVNTLLLGNPSCPAYLQPDDRQDACAKKSRALLKQLVARPDIARVFFFARGSALVGGDRQYGGAPSFPGPYFLATQQAAIDLLHGAGKRVFVVGENPHTAIQPGSCIARPLRQVTRDCRVERSWVEAGEAPYREWVAKLRRATIIDPLPAFCDASHCTMFDHGVLLYADDAHLSAAGSAYMAEKVLAPYLQ